MRTIEVDIEVGRSRNDYVTVIHSGDDHIGTNVDEDLMRLVVDRIEADDRCYWINTGDKIDCIQKRDWRFEVGTLPDWFTIPMLADPVKYQMEHYVDVWGRVADRCLATCFGNHEDKLNKNDERDVYLQLDETLGIPRERSLTDGGFVRLRFVSSEKVIWRPTIFMHHGRCASRKTGAIVNSLEELPQGFDADVYLVGHAHKKVVKKDRRLFMDDRTGEIGSRSLCYSCTGSYMRYEDSTDSDRGHYAGRKLYYPEEVGPVELRFYPNRKEIKIVL